MAIKYPIVDYSGIPKEILNGDWLPTVDSEHIVQDQDNGALYLTPTGVSPDIYGSTLKIPVLDIDEYGRILSASTVDIIQPVDTSIYLNDGSLTDNRYVNLNGYSLTFQSYNTSIVVDNLQVSLFAISEEDLAYYSVVSVTSEATVLNHLGVDVLAEIRQDDTNTYIYFNGSGLKITDTSVILNKLTGSGTVPLIISADGTLSRGSAPGAANFTAITPLNYNNGTGVLTIQVANTSQNGYLSSTDWNTFNTKEPAITNPNDITRFWRGDKTFQVLNTASLNDFPSQSGNSGKVLGTDGTTLSWVTASASSTVNSITLTTPDIIFNTPVTFANTSGAWSGTLSLKTHNKNLVFASDATTNGLTPIFRSLVAADIPNLDWAKITTGKPTTIAGYGITDFNSLGDARWAPITGGSGYIQNQFAISQAARFWIGGSYTANSSTSNRAVNAKMDASLTASNINQTLIGLDVTPTYSTGGYTGVKTIAINMNGDLAVNENKLLSAKSSAYVSLGFNVLPNFTPDATSLNNIIAVGSSIGTALTPSSSGILTAFGTSMFTSLTTGSNNVGLGRNIGNNLTTGSDNVLIGLSVGQGLVTGVRNIIIGFPAGITGDFDDCIVFGYNAAATQSRQIQFGNVRAYDLLSFNADAGSLNNFTMRWPSTPAGSIDVATGKTIWFEAGRGTGTGIGTSFVFRVAPPNTISASTQNAYIDAFTIHTNGYVTMPIRGTAPSGTPLNGSLYYNNTTGSLQLYTLDSWKALAFGDFVQNQVTTWQTAGFRIVGPAYIQSFRIGPEAANNSVSIPSGNIFYVYGTGRIETDFTIGRFLTVENTATFSGLAWFQATNNKAGIVMSANYGGYAKIGTRQTTSFSNGVSGSTITTGRVITTWHSSANATLTDDAFYVENVLTGGSTSIRQVGIAPIHTPGTNTQPGQVWRTLTISPTVDGANSLINLHINPTLTSFTGINYAIVAQSGMIRFIGLASGVTSPTTNGATKMLVIDADGLVSTAAIPSGGGGDGSNYYPTSITAAGGSISLSSTNGMPTISATASGTWGINISGNAATVSNGLYSTTSYADPSWLTSLAWSKINNAPAFLTTESDPVFSASAAAGITAQAITNWNTAFGWGPHASLYARLDGSYNNPTWITGLAWSKISGAPAFLTQETDPIFSAHVAATITSGMITNWNTAFSWGAHAGQYVRLDGLYANPSWLTSLHYDKITNIPTLNTYIQNQNASAQTANAWISGSLKAASVTVSSGDLTLSSKTGSFSRVGVINASGVLTTDVLPVERLMYVGGELADIDNGAIFIGATNSNQAYWYNSFKYDGIKLTVGIVTPLSYFRTDINGDFYWSLQVSEGFLLNDGVMTMTHQYTASSSNPSSFTAVGSLPSKSFWFDDNYIYYKTSTGTVKRANLSTF